MSDIHKIQSSARAEIWEALTELGNSKAEVELNLHAQFIRGYFQALKLFPNYEETEFKELEASFHQRLRSQSAKITD